MKEEFFAQIAKWNEEDGDPEAAAANAEKPLDAEKAREFIIRDCLHGFLGMKDVIKDGCLYCPDSKLTVRPEIESLMEQGAVVDFHIEAPQWGTEIFECCASPGENTRHALGMTLSSFMLSLMPAIVRMERGEYDETFETSFAGQNHRWRATLSDVVGMGNTPHENMPKFYWDKVKEGVMKRLGNQKLCYVKIYCANVDGDVTGECRVNDIKSKELSDVIAEIGAQWKPEGFASQKMFILIRQDEETVAPYPYWGSDGRAELLTKIKLAVNLFNGCKTQEEYEKLPEALKTQLGDPTLAEECYLFLPEICAENEFDTLDFDEQIAPGVYKAQLADYWTMHNLLFELFAEGAFGDAASEIYWDYITFSSIYGVVCKMMEKNGEDAPLEGCVSTHFNFSDGFKLR
ncbi:MAG TPA: hypothetical protein IAC22_07420 [Candidatus Caccocola faecipullorum]|nr:hypothetical protein [Candidatus Caccocola faecipullorum]